MISPWTIYWIMQLDSIGCFLGFVSVASAALAAGFLFIGALVTDRGCYPSEEQDSSWDRIKNCSVRLAVLAVVVGTISAFIPSSRTAAAVALIPAIANNETVQKQAGELYQLAKDGLRELVKPDEPKK